MLVWFHSDVPYQFSNFLKKCKQKTSVTYNQVSFSWHYIWARHQIFILCLHPITLHNGVMPHKTVLTSAQFMLYR